jgi:hypothetical protein
MITAQGPGRFELLCVTGGTNGDNTLQSNGTLNPTFFKVTWHDGSTWRRVGKCGCACHPPSDTGCNQMCPFLRSARSLSLYTPQA